MKIISTPHAPAAIGPYSQAVVSNGFAFLSGQIPLDPATGQLIEGEIAAQTQRVLENLKAVLESCGSSLDKVVKTTVYLTDMREFARRLKHDCAQRVKNLAAFLGRPPRHGKMQHARRHGAAQALARICSQIDKT